jgi:hypothetical protein
VQQSSGGPRPYTAPETPEFASQSMLPTASGAAVFAQNAYIGESTIPPIKRKSRKKTTSRIRRIFAEGGCAPNGKPRLARRGTVGRPSDPVLPTRHARFPCPRPAARLTDTLQDNPEYPGCPPGTSSPDSRQQASSPATEWVGGVV